jgi:enediyne biosynthesis protein E4
VVLRAFAAFLVAVAVAVHGQGIASRDVKPAPRGKPSGIPFLARFVDVAAQAGLAEPVIYGGVDRRDYILETTVLLARRAHTARLRSAA